MAGYKTFVAGEEALAADVNSYLMSQAIARFANASARTAALTAPTINQLSMLDTSPGRVDFWDGSAWQQFGPAAELQYVPRTSNMNITSTTAAAPDLVIDGTARTYDGTPILVEFSSQNVFPAGGQMQIVLLDASSTVAVLATLVGGGSTSYPVLVRHRLVPTAASHTYRIAAWLSTGTGTISGGSGTSGAVVPAYMRITKA